MDLRSAVLGALLVSGCTERYIVTQPATPSPANPTESTETTDTSEIAVDVPSLSASESSILVTPDKHLDRPTEVVGIIDFHSRAENEDKGFDQLRAKAASMGADAVIGAEFEHGESGGLSHLSGMAVRYR